jgi:hypothetical protein
VVEKAFLTIVLTMGMALVLYFFLGSVFAILTGIFPRWKTLNKLANKLFI